MTHTPARAFDGPDTALQVYLLGRLDFEAALRFQRRLHFDVSGNRERAALVLCEHDPIITVGRQGSHAHLRCEPEDLQARRWPVRWLNRAGGCLLHVPGQLAIYPIFPLDRLGLTVPAYLTALTDVILGLIGDFSIRAAVHADDAGLWINHRLLAAIGVSVRDWVSSYGAYLNIDPALDLFRIVQVTPGCTEPMTSLVCERHGPVRPSLVRERLIEHFQVRFGFTDVTLFTDHPSLAGCVQRCEPSKIPSAVPSDQG